ncbi:MAG: PAS domain S-box protein [Solirubrobacterales bacterium]|nr:PAS domain S-box protein [Solirubrobacterales bacterium]
MSNIPDGSEGGPFWSVFERSHIPMALVDRELRFVAVNDAASALYQYPRQEVIGRQAGTHFVGGRSSSASHEWQKLLRKNELYGERVIAHPSGRSLRVSYAAHGTEVNGRWLALFVTLSAKLEPHGIELIKAAHPGAGGGAAASDPGRQQAGSLTAREREVVRLVSLGRSTPQIASDLGLSPATVRSHVRNAMVKVGAHTRAQLVALVIGEGLAEP